jgi:uncharacterized membrane protein YgcG
MISSHLSPGLPSGVFLNGFQHFLNELVCSTHSEHPTHLTSKYIMFDEAKKKYKVFHCVNFSIAPVIFLLLGIGHAGCFL